MSRACNWLSIWCVACLPTSGRKNEREREKRVEKYSLLHLQVKNKVKAIRIRARGWGERVGIWEGEAKKREGGGGESS